MKETAKHRLRTVSHLLVAMLLAVGMAEGFLRLLVPVEIQFETWFTPGIETYDPVHGVVYQPNWRGMMRHTDGVYRGVPLQLDAHGFRLPARNAQAGAPVRILLLGGRSSLMSYGLPDNETVAAALAANLPFAAEVHCIASAGGTLKRDWLQYRAHLSQARYDLVIVSHVNPHLPLYADAAAYDTPPPIAPEAWYFRFMDGIVLWRDGLFAAVGRPAFASWLGNGLLRLADAGQRAWRQRHVGALSTHDAAIRTQSRPPDAEGLADYLAFLAHVRRHFAREGTPVLIHFIPRRYFPAEHHAPYREALPADWAHIDLHAALHPLLQEDVYIANHHYAAPLTAAMGAALAPVVTELLGAAPQRQTQPAP